MHTSSHEGVLKANVKGCIRKGGEGHALLACNILGSAEVIAYGVFDLCAGLSTRFSSAAVCRGATVEADVHAY